MEQELVQAVHSFTRTPCRLECGNMIKGIHEESVIHGDSAGERI